MGFIRLTRKRDATAKRYETVSYDQILRDNLKVMDTTAVSLCRDNHMPMMVFSMREQGNIKRVVAGEPLGTLVTP